MISTRIDIQDLRRDEAKDSKDIKPNQELSQLVRVTKRRKPRRKIPLEDLNWEFFSESSEGLKDPITRQLTILPIKPTADSKLQPIEKGALLKFMHFRHQQGLDAYHPLNQELKLTPENIRRYHVDANYILKRNQYLQKFGYSEMAFLNYRNVKPQEYQFLHKTPLSFKLLNYLNKLILIVGPYVLVFLTDKFLFDLMKLNENLLYPPIHCDPALQEYLLATRSSRTFTTDKDFHTTFAPLQNFITIFDDVCPSAILRLKKHSYFDVFTKGIDTPIFKIAQKNMTSLIELTPELSNLIPNLFKENHFVRNQYAYRFYDFRPWILNISAYFRSGVALLAIPNHQSFMDNIIRITQFTTVLYVELHTLNHANSFLVETNTTVNACNQIDVRSTLQNITLAEPCEELSATSFYAGMSLRAAIFLLQFIIMRNTHRILPKVSNLIQFFAPKPVPINYFERDTVDEVKERPENNKRCSMLSNIRERCVIL